MEPRLLLRGNAWECMAYRAIEIRRTTVSDCVEMRGTAASNCMEMRGTAARKCVEMRGTAACVEMRVAWTPSKGGSSARDASGKREWEAGLKCSSSAWNRGSTHWWVPYLYGTVTLRVNTGDPSLVWCSRLTHSWLHDLGNRNLLLEKPIMTVSQLCWSSGCYALH